MIWRASGKLIQWCMDDLDPRTADEAKVEHRPRSNIIKSQSQQAALMDVGEHAMFTVTAAACITMSVVVYWVDHPASGLPGSSNACHSQHHGSLQGQTAVSFFPSD